MGALTKLLALRKILESKSAPMDEIRDVGHAFASRSPNVYFENFKRPIEDARGALAQYGVQFSPASSRKINAIMGDAVYDVEKIVPADFKARSMGAGPSLGRLLEDSTIRNKLYEIDSRSTSSGDGAGSKMYPAIFDLFSGAKGLVNTPTQLTLVNEMRRNANTADALIRNPRLADLILPIDEQLNVLKVTPEDYVTFDYPEKVGALVLANAAKALERGDRFASSAPTLPDVADAENALRRFEALSPMSSRDAFREAATVPFRTRGIGESTMRRMNIVDAILAGKRFNPDLWMGLGKKRGGLV